MNNRRRKDLRDCLHMLSQIETLIDDIGTTLGYVQMEEEMAYDNAMDHFPNSEKTDKLEENNEALQELLSEYEDTMKTAFDDFKESVEDFETDLSAAIDDM